MRSVIIILSIVIICNVIALQQWLSSGCCKEMAVCESAISCFVSGCHACVKISITTVAVISNGLKKQTINVSLPVTRNIKNFSQDIWHPPKLMNIYS